LRRIDLHIHTIPTIREPAFTFSLDTFKRYVDELRLDAVAVTNHDVFNGTQFKQIQKALSATVFPGIEINVEKGHVLIVGSPTEIDDFQSKATMVAKQITKLGDCISVEELIRIYGDLGRYLVIPHYDKGPSLNVDALEKLKPFVCAGEVDSAKKFVRAIKDETKLTPVLFSDSRMKDDLANFSTRQTFVDCGTLTLGALKACLRDKAKVALSESDGNRLWQVLEDGQKLSTGLNVLIGARSTGKTHTLDAISKTVENVKYIEQFSLVQQNEALYEREFTSNVEKSRSTLADDYLSGLKRVLDEVINVDAVANGRAVQRYLETLLKSASETERHDAFSKATLFDEVDFPVGKTNTLSDLIESVRQVVENVEFRTIIEKHLDIESLKTLARELIELLRARTLEFDQKKLVNRLVKEIKQGLKLRTAATQIEDVDLYKICMDTKRIQRFDEIVGFLKKEAVIFDETLQGFRIEAWREPYVGATELRDASGVRTAFSDAFRKYDSPYEYLQELLANENVSRAGLYKLFVKIGYRILNSDGFEVSGGERSEFRLLQEIAHAQNYDILLIDEPESSFDNLFLKSDVNQILKGISETMPVVVVTHNNTVGASVGADYLLYTRKEIEDGKVVYRIYSGYPTDKTLLSVDGKEISSHEVMMDSLEAGVTAYESRRLGYEAIKH
jgi:ABC-type dipeptide/oligopeptide/nickel transport system ATPase component